MNHSEETFDTQLHRTEEIAVPPVMSMSKPSAAADHQAHLLVIYSRYAFPLSLAVPSHIVSSLPPPKMQTCIQAAIKYSVLALSASLEANLVTAEYLAPYPHPASRQRDKEMAVPSWHDEPSYQLGVMAHNWAEHARMQLQNDRGGQARAGSIQDELTAAGAYVILAHYYLAMGETGTANELCQVALTRTQRRLHLTCPSQHQKEAGGPDVAGNAPLRDSQVKSLRQTLGISLLGTLISSALFAYVPPHFVEPSFFHVNGGVYDRDTECIYNQYRYDTGDEQGRDRVPNRTIMAHRSSCPAEDEVESERMEENALLLALRTSAAAFAASTMAARNQLSRACAAYEAWLNGLPSPWANPTRIQLTQAKAMAEEASARHIAPPVPATCFFLDYLLGQSALLLIFINQLPEQHDEARALTHHLVELIEGKNLREMRVTTPFFAGIGLVVFAAHVYFDLLPSTSSVTNLPDVSTSTAVSDQLKAQVAKLAWWRDCKQAVPLDRKGNVGSLPELAKLWLPPEVANAVIPYLGDVPLTLFRWRTAPDFKDPDFHPHVQTALDSMSSSSTLPIQTSSAPFARSPPVSSVLDHTAPLAKRMRPLTGSRESPSSPLSATATSASTHRVYTGTTGRLPTSVEPGWVDKASTATEIADGSTTSAAPGRHSGRPTPHNSFVRSLPPPHTAYSHHARRSSIMVGELQRYTQCSRCPPGDDTGLYTPLRAHAGRRHSATDRDGHEKSGDYRFPSSLYSLYPNSRTMHSISYPQQGRAGRHLPAPLYSPRGGSPRHESQTLPPPRSEGSLHFTLSSYQLNASAQDDKAATRKFSAPQHCSVCPQQPPSGQNADNTGTTGSVPPISAISPSSARSTSCAVGPHSARHHAIPLPRVALHSNEYGGSHPKHAEKTYDYPSHEPYRADSSQKEVCHEYPNGKEERVKAEEGRTRLEADMSQEAPDPSGFSPSSSSPASSGYHPTPSHSLPEAVHEDHRSSVTFLLNAPT